MKKHLFALLALILVLGGCPSTPPELDAGEQRIPDATLVPDASHKVGSFNPTCTGTGLPKIVSGVQSSACATLVNADVNAAAAIDGTKVSPNFGSQNVVTTGTLTLGSSPSTAGNIALPNVSQVYVRNPGGSGNLVAIATDATGLFLGSNNAFGERQDAINAYAGSAVAVGIVSSTYLYVTGGNLQAWVPITGSSLGSSPYSVHGKTTVATAPPFTLAAADYAKDAIMLSNAGAGTVTFPAPGTDAGAYYKTVINTGAGTKTLTDGGASTPTLATNLSGHYLFDTAGVHLTGPSVAYP